MLWIYDGPGADQVGEGHEGLARLHTAAGKRIPISPTLGCGPEVWQFWQGRADHLTAACSCGWHGEYRHPVSEANARTAREQWRREHLQPVIAAAAGPWPGWAQRMSQLAVEVARHVTAGRLADAARVFDAFTDAATTRRRMLDRLTAEQAGAVDADGR